MMAAVVNAENDRAGDEYQTCQAPSCWEDGTPVEIEGENVGDDPVLCEIHRQGYLGVSS